MSYANPEKAEERNRRRMARNVSVITDFVFVPMSNLRGTLESHEFRHRVARTKLFNIDGGWVSYSLNTLLVEVIIATCYVKNATTPPTPR